jgi:hypothetical protein
MSKRNSSSSSRRDLDFNAKYEIISELDKNPTANRSQIAAKYKVSNATITRIYSEQKEKILQRVQSGDYRNAAKRVRQVTFDDVDRELLTWFKNADAQNLEGLTGAVLLEKAQQLAQSLGHENPGVLKLGWIERWKARHEIVHKSISGEAGKITPEMTNEWIMYTLPTLLKKYKPEDVYNIDELGLFWKLLPEGTLTFKNKKCVGGKRSKERLTILCGCNMTGRDKLPLLAIGKTAVSITLHLFFKSHFYSALFCMCQL